jgi:hypothetical protein
MVGVSSLAFEFNGMVEFRLLRVSSWDFLGVSLDFLATSRFSATILLPLIQWDALQVSGCRDRLQIYSWTKGQPSKGLFNQEKFFLCELKMVFGSCML